MSTIPCPACNDKVSTGAKVCPHCGHPLTLGRSQFEGIKDLFGCAFAIIILFFIVVMFVALFSS